MVVINNTHLSPEKALKNLKKTTRGNLKYKYLLSALLIVGGLIVTIFANTFNEGAYKEYIIIGLMLLIIGGGHFALNTYNLLSAEKKIKKNNDAIMQSGVDYDYKFKEQSIQVSAKDAIKTSKYEYKYDEVGSVSEFNDYYEMRLKNGQVLYIEKSGFNEPKMEEFFKKNLSINKKKIRNYVK
ncbi:MAG: YcxB family protein [Acholeplasmatales bacterium]|nr:YcxB family protein [Acholeplasmatales bacterium]